MASPLDTWLQPARVRTRHEVEVAASPSQALAAALGIPAGFPGGPANHQLMMTSAWRYIDDVIVIILSAMAILISLTLLRPPHQMVRRWVPHTAAWIAGGMFLVAWLAGSPRSGSA